MIPSPYHRSTLWKMVRLWRIGKHVGEVVASRPRRASVLVRNTRRPKGCVWLMRLKIRRTIGRHSVGFGRVTKCLVGVSHLVRRILVLGTRESFPNAVSPAFCQRAHEYRLWADRDKWRCGFILGCLAVFVTLRVSGRSRKVCDSVGCSLAGIVVVGMYSEHAVREWARHARMRLQVNWRASGSRMYCECRVA